MKTIKKYALIGVALIAPLAAMANNPIVELKKSESKKSVLLEIGNSQEEAKITILDNNLQTLFKEEVYSNYSKSFNLEELAEGRYLFMVKMKDKSLKYTLDVDKSQLNILDTKEDAAYEIFQAKDGRLNLSLLNLERKPVLVNIINPDGYITHEDKFEGELTVERSYNFEKALKGTYEVVVVQGDNVYRQKIKN